MSQPKDATSATLAAQAALLASLPAEDGVDFERARRGFIDTLPDARVETARGGVAWDLSPFDFQGGGAPAPDTVNPSLWRLAQLNLNHGLYRVTEGIYQVRGFDLSNITFVEGNEGFIVVDPLTSAEPAAAALALMRKHRGDKPVSAVIYTHSHVDHFAGVRGIVTDDDVADGRVRVIAPAGFLAEAVSENVLAGNAMGRRATYMYGALLHRGPRGHVDSGLGKAVSSGQVNLIAPTESISKTGTRLTLDGVEIVFQVTPGTEAPAEMNFFFPRHRALCMAENCTCQLHNLYTPRGAQVRDAKAWSFYIDEAIDLFADQSEVLFASHHWPRWGKADQVAFLEKQSDLYKFIHDQTLRLANHGLTPLEIAEQVKLPPSLADEWHTRSYYGTISHNTKAVYQRYLGWFDGNPANLHKHPPEAAARRYVDAIGGADAVLAKGRAAFDAGDYRWVAELVNHLVFADPDNMEARNLQADALEQLGYQAESGPWRDFYLTGAQELRLVRPKATTPRQGATGQLRTLPADQLLDSLSVRLNGDTIGRAQPAMLLTFTDADETFSLKVRNGVLHHRPAKPSETAIRLSRNTLVDLVVGDRTLEAAVTDGLIEGDAAPLGELLMQLDRFDFWFEIVLP